jgi:hypothetical protein
MDSFIKTSYIYANVRIPEQLSSDENIWKYTIRVSFEIGIDRIK